MDYTLEALEAGVIQLLLLFVLPLVVSLNLLWGMVAAYFTRPPPMLGDNHPPNAPPPPPPPDAVAVAMDSLFDYAFDHPAIYFMCNFAIFLGVALFFLFLDDINKWRERQKAEAIAKAQLKAKRQEERRKLAARGLGYEELKDDEEDLEALKAAAEDELRKLAAKPAIDLPAMKRELYSVTDKAEELEIKTKGTCCCCRLSSKKSFAAKVGAAIPSSQSCNAASFFCSERAGPPSILSRVTSIQRAQFDVRFCVRSLARCQ